MISFKFRVGRGPHYVDVSLFAGERDKTYQLAGMLKLNPYEWDMLRKTMRNLPGDNVELVVEEA